jgi:hypothetical protein
MVSRVAEHGAMQIVLNLERTSDGRVTGSAEAGGRIIPFSGSMELLAAIERLCAPTDARPD